MAHRPPDVHLCSRKAITRWRELAESSMVMTLPVGLRFYAGPRRVLNRRVQSDRHFMISPRARSESKGKMKERRRVYAFVPRRGTGLALTGTGGVEPASV